MIYFVQAGRHGPIKIGAARDVARRLVKMRVDNHVDLHVLGVMDGDFRAERRLHQRFHEFRLFGEWFKAAAPILEEAQRWPWSGDIKPPRHVRLAAETEGLIEALGGAKAAARLCRISVDALRKWHPSVPSKHWRQVSVHLGIPMEDIMKIGRRAVGDDTPRKRKPNGRAA